MSGDGKVCITIGKAAGGIVRTTTKTSKKIGEVSKEVGGKFKYIYKGIGGKTMTICKKFGNLYKNVKGRGSIARWEENEKDVYTRLGAEVWNLYKEKVFKSVFEQNSVKVLIDELKGYDKEIQERKEAMIIQKKKMDELEIFKQAKANLGSKNPRIRKVAIKVLNKLGNKLAIPYLNKMLGDPVAEVRELAAKVLHRLVDLSLQRTPLSARKTDEIKKMMDESEEEIGDEEGEDEEKEDETEGEDEEKEDETEGEDEEKEDETEGEEEIVSRERKSRKKIKTRRKK